MIALGLVNNPKLLIADEPTTALDVTVQAQILDLLNDLQKEFGSAVILITHDLAVVAETADDILVMYAGRGVEKRHCQGGARPAVAPLHLGPAPVAALALARTLDRAQGDQGRAAQPAQPAVGLLVPPPLRLQDGRSSGDACLTDAARVAPDAGA